MDIHIPTVFLMIIAISAALGVSVAMVVKRAEQDGVALWGIGLACHAAAYAIFAMRSALPPVLAILVPHLVLAVCFAVFAEALLRFQRQRHTRALIWSPVASVAIVFPFLLDAIEARIVAVGVVIAYQNLLLLWLIWRQRLVTVGRGQSLIVVGACALTVLFLYRSAVTLLGHNPMVSLTEATPVHVLSLMVAAISMVFMTIGFLTMAKERAEARIARLAMRDALTGVHNRRSILEILAQQMASARRQIKPLCILLLDIDHFKRVNDTHGHLVGDHVLREMTRTVSARLRTEDTVGRYGGEEFLLLLPGVDKVRGLEIAERIRRDIAAMPIRLPSGVQLPLTISIGLTEFDPKRHSDTDDIVNEADHALYYAKGNGRNRSVISDAKMAAAPITMPAPI
jgi:diguanylate cyclase (GGDEF)-like protein